MAVMVWVIVGLVLMLLVLVVACPVYVVDA
jgi:hypothetical protein